MQVCGKALLFFGFVLSFVCAQDDVEPLEDDMQPEELGEEIDPSVGPDDFRKPEFTDAQMEGLFRVMDTKKAGKIPVAEFQSFGTEMRRHHVTKRKLNDDGYFTSLDMNGDGKVSKDEVLPPDMQNDTEEYARDFRAHEEAKFKASDKNSDGFLDLEEFGPFEWPEIDEAVENAYAQAIFDTKDKNKDGKLTIQEWYPHDLEDAPHDDFKKLDLNGDGKLDFEEVKTWESGRHFAEERMKFVAGHADTNKDGQVTLQEFIATRAALIEIEEHRETGYQFEDWAMQLEL